MEAGTGLKLDVRRNRILEELSRQGKVRVADLSKHLEVSEVTIRNDLSELEKAGYLERVSGGAVQRMNHSLNLGFQHRKQENADCKRAVAAAVAELVRDGETLLINSGTTTYLTALELKRHKNLNIVTNSIPVAQELGNYPTFRVILLGGEINPQYSFLYGIDALEQLHKYKADKAILSVDGVCSDAGLTTYHAEEAEVNKLMMERSRCTVVAADSTKIGRESFSNMGSVERAGILVTNSGLRGNEVLREIESLGIEVRFADPVEP